MTQAGSSAGGTDGHQTPLLPYCVAPQVTDGTGVACRSSDYHLRQWVTVGKEQTPHLAGPGETSQNEHAAAKPL